MKLRTLILPLLLGLQACAPDYLDLGVDFVTTTTSGTTGSGGTGGGGVCAPGEAQACYSGPAGTEGKGLCKPGQQKCNAEGTAFGPCEGQVLPKQEDCATPQDEDCNGLAPPCKGQFLWAKRFGDPKAGVPSSACRVNAVAADLGTGNLGFTGAFNAIVDFGGGPLTSVGGNDVLSAVLDTDGGYVRGARFGDGDGQAGIGMVFAPQSGPILAGIFSGVLDFGNGALAGAGSTDLFLASFDTKGAPQWSRRFGDGGPQDRIVTAMDSAGHLGVTGGFFSSLDFGGGPLSSSGGEDAFVAKLAGDGSHLWSKRFGDAMFQQGQGIAFDGAGNVIVTGVFAGAIDLGGGALQSAGGQDIFLAKLSPDGALVWAKTIGDDKLQQNAVVTVDAAGNILVAGSFYGAVDLGAGPMVSAGEADVFLAKLTPDGAHLWSKRFGDSANQLGVSIAFDVQNNILLAGSLVGAADFGGGPLASAGGNDVFVAKLDPNGDHLWSKRFGDAADQQVTGVTSDATGAVFLGGYFAGALDLGGGAMTAKGGMSDGFVAKFSP